MRAHRNYLILLLHLIVVSVSAQQVIPPNVDWFNQQEIVLEDALERSDTMNALNQVLAWDPVLASLQTEYPEFVSLKRAEQAWFLIVPNQASTSHRKIGQQRLLDAVQLIGGNGRRMMDSLSAALHQMAKRYQKAGLIDFLGPFDREIRKAIPRNATSLNDFSISYYLWAKEFLSFSDAKELTEYEELFLTTDSWNDSQGDRVGRSINLYYQTAADLKEWKSNPNDYDLKFLFKIYNIQYEICRRWFQYDRVSGEMKTEDAVESELDRLQANVYGLFLNDWAELAAVARESGVAANYLFLYLNDVLKPRFIYDQQAGRSLRQTYFYLQRTILNLTTLLNQTGQYQRCKLILDEAMSLFYDPEKGVDVRSSAIQPLWINHWVKTIEAGVGIKDNIINALVTGTNLAQLNRDVSVPGITDNNSRNWTLFLQSRRLDLMWVLARPDPKSVRAAADSVKLYLNALEKYVTRTGDVALPGRAAYLYQAAQLQCVLGDFEAATHLVGEAIRYLDRSDPVESGLYFRALALSVKLHAREQKSVTDTAALTQLLDHTRLELVRHMPSLSADQRTLFYANSLHTYFDLYHSLLAEGYIAGKSPFRKLIIEQSLALKNYFSTNTGMLMQQVSVSDEIRQFDLIRRNFDRWESYFSLMGDPQRAWDAYRNRVSSELAVRAEVSSSQWDSLFVLPQLMDLQRQLKAGDLYTEYVRFANCFRSDTTSYLAIIFNGNVDPVVRPLFAESALKSIAERSLQYSVGIQGGEGGLRGFEPEQTSASVRDADTLGRFLFSSLPEMAEAKRFLFVPDGLLNRIAFSALRWKGRYLFEQVAIRQLSSSGRLRNDVKRTDSLRFFLAGGIQYEKMGCNTEAPYRYLHKGYSWNYLPGSALEISRLSEILRRYKNIKVEVTNDIHDSIDLSGYTHLHLATHGFYFSEKMASSAIGDSYDKDYLKVSPLARCGLVIDRANCSGVSGYLLGYELANMNLSKCQLITLSACETALGDIKSNQGVLGLQQALKIAGAGKLLLAMWKIPDRETAEFMEVFYRHLIAESSEEEALRRTQSVLSKKYPISSWGAFTLID